MSEFLYMRLTLRNYLTARLTDSRHRTHSPSPAEDLAIFLHTVYRPPYPQLPSVCGLGSRTVQRTSGIGLRYALGPGLRLSTAPRF